MHNIDTKSIIALYNQTNKEITRYRDIEWRICYWTIALIAGTIASHKYILEIIPSYPFYICYFFNLFNIITALYGIWHICFVHSNFILNRNIQMKLEVILKLNKMKYHNRNILPAQWFNKDVSFCHGGF